MFAEHGGAFFFFFFFHKGTLQTLLRIKSITWGFVELFLKCLLHFQWSGDVATFQWASFNKGNVSNAECHLELQQILKKKKNVCVSLLRAFQCSFMSNLLRQGAAVLLRHAFPHRLLDRLDLLAQWDARCSGWFDHFSVNRLLFLILLSQRGGRRQREGKQEEKRGEKKKGDSLWWGRVQLILQAAGTYVGFRACVDHMERAVGQVKASEAACSLRGSQNTINWVPFKRSRYTNSPSTTQRGTTHSDSCSAQHGKRFH